MGYVSTNMHNLACGMYLHHISHHQSITIQAAAELALLKYQIIISDCAPPSLPPSLPPCYVAKIPALITTAGHFHKIYLYSTLPEYHK